MSQRHYPINKEIEVDIKLKIQLHEISNFFKLDENDLENAINEIKNKLGEHIKYQLFEEQVFNDDLSENFDSFSYSIK